MRRDPIRANAQGGGALARRLASGTRELGLAPA